MKNLWQKFLADEAGVVLSSEMALVGTVGVLGMVVGLESVTCAVTSELNDLAGAFGAINQTYNYNSLNKARHARVSGSGYNDRADFCDCQLISQTDVVGSSGLGTVQGGFSQALSSQSVVVDSAPVVREEIVQERVVDGVPVVTETIKAVECPEDEIIEEHIIRRRVKSDCDCSKTATTVIPKAKSSKPAPSPMPEEKIETKPKPKKKG